MSKLMSECAEFVRPITTVLLEDWRTHKHSPFALILILMTMLVVLAYYANHPAAEPLADTWSYLYVVDHIQTHGQLVNFWRLPGYPLFIVLLYTLSGQGNLEAVSIAQAVLFIFTTLEIYILIILITRQTWIAFIISLLVGMNLTILSYIKPIMSEALALWLVTSLALAVVSFITTWRTRFLWLATLFLFLLVFTRPEWIYLPVPLFGYVLLISIGKKAVLRMLPHILASVLFLYASLGGYIYINATENHLANLTWIENINMLGKVLQYHMQDEAPPQYASIMHTLDTYVSKGMLDPYPILANEPSLARNYAAPAGEFSKIIIEQHPIEFFLKSVPVFFSSLTDFHDESRIFSNGAYGPSLAWLQSQFRMLYQWNIVFPYAALIWLFLLCWRKTRQFSYVQSMGVIMLLSLYGLSITTFGAYRGYDYMRIHILFDPLLTLVIGCTLLWGIQMLVQHFLRHVSRDQRDASTTPEATEELLRK